MTESTRLSIELRPTDPDEMSLDAGLQRTLGHAISCVGVGRHCGARVGLTLHPAPADSGIRFRRTDRPGSSAIDARPENLMVNDHAFVLTDGEGMRIVGIENVMAALIMTGIDNALVEISGPELPAMDGSARPFVFLIECAGAATESAPRRPGRALGPLELRRGAMLARLTPSPMPRLYADLAHNDLAEADQDAAKPLRHAVALRREALRQELAAARRSMVESDLEAVQERGLMRGVSLDNTLLLGAKGPANPGGYRYLDEQARHANLMALAALALLGGLPPVTLETRGANFGLLARLMRQCLVQPTSTIVPAGDAALRCIGLGERAN